MTPFFTQFVLSHASDNTVGYFLKYWGDGCMGRPHLKFFGRPSPSPPKSPPMLEEALSKSPCRMNEFIKRHNIVGNTNRHQAMALFSWFSSEQESPRVLCS